MQVKVCGIRTPEGARACAEAGVDFVGLNFVPGVRRAVSPESARILLSRLGAARPVAVVRDQAPAEVEGLCADLGIRWVQLHGAETPAVCAGLAGVGLEVIKAVSIGTDADRVREYAQHAAVLLVDGRDPGSGQTWAWSELDALRRACGDRRPGEIAGRPFWVAGGLDPGNVADAIATLDPAGVDAASGTERDGHTDAGRVAAFCKAARRARGITGEQRTGGES